MRTSCLREGLILFSRAPSWLPRWAAWPPHASGRGEGPGSSWNLQVSPHHPHIHACCHPPTPCPSRATSPPMPRHARQCAWPQGDCHHLGQARGYPGQRFSGLRVHRHPQGLLRMHIPRIYPNSACPSPGRGLCVLDKPQDRPKSRGRGWGTRPGRLLETGAKLSEEEGFSGSSKMMEGRGLFVQPL